MYLFFDTETTGLPKNWNAPVIDVENWPRIIQLAYIVCDKDGNIIKTVCELIKPQGWEVPSIGMFVRNGLSLEQATKEAKFWIDNCYSQEKNEANGVFISKVVFHFIKDLESCQYLIAHNMSYDEKVIGAEMIRLGMKSEKRVIKICTKEKSTNICKLPHANGGRGYKWPKLEELHNFLFNEGFDGAHDALNDVKAMKKCFFELLNRKLIII